MMARATFTAYAIPTDGYPVGLPNPPPTDHTFVVYGPGAHDEWRCWGRGKETTSPGAKPASRLIVSQEGGIPRWGQLIYGAGPDAPDNFVEKVEGVCQNVANRLLVLAGDVEVREAQGYWLTILLYGRFGYHVEAFVADVKNAAAQVNREVPGTISQAELEAVVARIKPPDVPNEELKILEAHFRSALPPTLPAPDVALTVQSYVAFQATRKALFDANSPPNSLDANSLAAYQQEWAQTLLPPLKLFLSQVAGPLRLDLPVLEAQLPYHLSI